MKLLYGTANPAKLEHMRATLHSLGIEIIGLNEVKLEINPIDESGNNPLANARIKAEAYYQAVHMPVFSCDSGLYIEGLAEEEQPGVHVRRVQGKILNDEEMIEYYTSLAAKAGGELVAQYKNAICLIFDENTRFEYDGDDIGSVRFLLAAKPHAVRTPGFPLDSISLEIESGEYYMDLEARSSENVEDSYATGFRNFFTRVLEAVETFPVAG